MKYLVFWVALCCVTNTASQCAMSSEQKTVPASLETTDIFGAAVDIHLSLSVSGAPNDENPDGVATGVAYIEENVGGVWNLSQALYPSVGESGDWFGAAVAISAQYVAVGAPNSNLYDFRGGAVFIFKRQPDGQFVETQILPGNNIFDYYKMGFSLAMSGNRLLVGVPQATGSTPGDAILFELEDDVWVLSQHLNQGNVPHGSQYGHTVDIEGDFAIVSAPYVDGDTNHEGVAHVYTFNGTGFVLDQVLSSSNPQNQGRFGTGVAITPFQQLVVTGRCALSGSDQCALYHHNGLEWVESELFENSGLDYDFGASVDMVGDQVIVGVPGYDDDGLSDIGAAFVFDVSAGTLNQTQTIKASDRSGYDGFGNAVSIWNNRLIVGASKEDQFAPDQGAVYHYSCNLVGGIGGCTNPCALNYSPNADYDDGSCSVYCAAGCPGDVNGDGQIDINDLILILGLFGVICD